MSGPSEAMAQTMLANFLVTDWSSAVGNLFLLPGEIKSTALWRPALAISSLSQHF